MRTDRQPHPYYVVAPPYRDSSAGVRVMHRLCHMLNERGCEAYIVGTKDIHAELDTPHLDHAVATLHRMESRFPIAVYPEIISGNPLHAPVCVRYMLNKEGVVEGNTIQAGPDDLFFYYSTAFTPDRRGKFDYLRPNVHNLELFKPDPQQARTRPLLYVNRIPLSAIDLTALPGDIEVLSNSTPLPLPDLARKLQSATVLYSYEQSATCTLAMLCGCPLVALTLPGYESLGFSAQSLSIYGNRGFALDDSEASLRIARDTLPAFRLAAASHEERFERELKNFIVKTQSLALQVARQTLDIDSGSSEGSPANTGTKLISVVVATSAEPDPATLSHLNAQMRRTDALHVASVSPVTATLCEQLAALCPPDGGKCRGAPIWLVLIDDGDRLKDTALAALDQICQLHPQLGWIQSDADVSCEDGTTRTLYPPDAGKRLLRSGFALIGVLAVRSDILCSALQHCAGLDASNWRQALPYVLLQVSGKTRFMHAAEPWVTHRSVPYGHPQLLRPPASADYGGADEAPVVSMLVPSRNQLPALQRLLESIFEQTTDITFEIILVAHQTTDSSVRDFLSGLPSAAPGRLSVLDDEQPFNFSRLINRAARIARGRFLLLLNNDIAALHPEWLRCLVAEFDDEEVGIVSPRLVFPDGRLQHAGAVLGLNGSVDFPWVGAPMDEGGHLELLHHAREVSAVSGAAMMIRRGLFESLDGMDEAYDIGFGDFDLCLRAGNKGYRCVWTPTATLMHEAGRTLKACFGSPEAAAEAGRAFEAARKRFVRTWLPQLGRDPYYNPNLSLTSRRWEPEREISLRPFPVLAPPTPRVLALPADASGSGHYRVIAPAEHAARDRMAATRLARGYPIPVQLSRLGIDTLFSQRQVDDNHLKALSELRELLPGLRIVMDFDDLLTEVPKHSHHATQVWPDIERRIQLACSLSDCITASTEPLAQRLRAWHGDVRVIPNGIDPVLWKPASEARPRSGKLRVGWAGGLSHAGDLAILRQALSALADEVEWVFFGMCLQDIQPHLTEFHHGVPFDEYPAKLASLRLDLALAPLEANTFNECKSNLRLLEYGAIGIPVIASDLQPYRCGLPVTLIDNRPQSWTRAIQERISEREALAAEGARLREAVLEHWTIDRFLPAWVDAWRG